MSSANENQILAFFIVSPVEGSSIAIIIFVILKQKNLYIVYFK